MTKLSSQAISSWNLQALPEPAILRQRLKALAALEAIICPEWEYRYYSYNASWDQEAGEEVATMRDGEGDEWLILFSAHGVIINGFVTDSEMNGWYEVTLANGEVENRQEVCAGMFDHLPQVFRPFLETEPVPSTGTSFCIWRLNTDTSWCIGNVDFSHYVNPYLENAAPPDGSAILYIVDGNPATYQEFAQNYYEKPLSLGAISRVYQGQAIDRDLVLELNPDLEDWAGLKEELEEIAYPHHI